MLLLVQDPFDLTYWDCNMMNYFRLTYTYPPLHHRMESTSLPMRIHCSERSAKLLRSQAPEIKLECRGNINVKGKGEMVTFWVGDDLICGEDLDLELKD